MISDVPLVPFAFQVNWRSPGRLVAHEGPSYSFDYSLQQRLRSYILIEFCVGGSKELAVLYESYSTAVDQYLCHTAPFGSCALQQRTDPLD